MRLLKDKPFKVRRNNSSRPMLRTNISSNQSVLKENEYVYEYEHEGCIILVPEKLKDEFERINDNE